MRTILRGESGLGFVKISPDGRHVVFSSTAAFAEDDPVDGNRRYVHLRERVTDFTPVPHLHLLDLTSGQDETITQFTGGWEVRPHGLAASPHGKSLIFLGPPEEVGGGRQEPNVYNKQIWSLDFASGEFQRLTHGLSLAFDVGGGLPRFDKNGRLLVEVTDGTAKRLARLDPEKEWAAELVQLSGESPAHRLLSILGKTVELVVFPGEGHGISGSWENRVEHRTMILDWFDKFCREQPEAWTERWE